MRPHAEDPDGNVAALAKSFIANSQDDTADVLKDIMNIIRDTVTYQTREEEKTQAPGETLSYKTGTCRDYAWLMIETLRRFGFSCRFISGYIYYSVLDGGEVGMVGSASTHA